MLMQDHANDSDDDDTKTKYWQWQYENKNHADDTDDDDAMLTRTLIQTINISWLRTINILLLLLSVSFFSNKFAWDNFRKNKKRRKDKNEMISYIQSAIQRQRAQ